MNACVSPARPLPDLRGIGRMLLYVIESLRELGLEAEARRLATVLRHVEETG